MQWSLLFYDQRRSYIFWLEICHHKFFWKCGPFQIFIYWYLQIPFCWSALFISFFAVYFLLAYLYTKLFTVFVYGSWICIFLYEYIWKSVYLPVCDLTDRELVRVGLLTIVQLPYLQPSWEFHQLFSFYTVHFHHCHQSICTMPESCHRATQVSCDDSESSCPIVVEWEPFSGGNN